MSYSRRLATPRTVAHSLRSIRQAGPSGAPEKRSLNFSHSSMSSDLQGGWLADTLLPHLHRAGTFFSAASGFGGGVWEHRLFSAPFTSSSSSLAFTSRPRLHPALAAPTAASEEASEKHVGQWLFIRGTIALHPASWQSSMLLLAAPKMHPFDEVLRNIQQNWR